MWAWGIALLGLPLQRGAALQVGGTLLAAAELSALPLLALGAWRALGGARPRLTAADRGVAAWGLAVGLASLVSMLRLGKLDPLVAHDAAATLFLGALYASIRLTADASALRWFPTLLLAGALTAGLLGLLGSAAAVLGVSNPLVLEMAYPYAGAVVRAQALCSTPNLLASVLMTALLLMPAERQLGRTARRVSAGVLLAAFAATLSKALLCLAGGGMLLLAARRGPRASRAAAAGVLALTGLYAAGSHFVVAPLGARVAELEAGMLISREPLLMLRGPLAGHGVFGTNYHHNKLVSLRAVADSFPWGIGPGRQPALAAELQRAGAYPPLLWHARPHGTPTGVAAEHGLVGLVGLGLLLWSLVRAWRALGGEDHLRWPLLALGTAAGMESLTTDQMHFRHYVWVIAVFSCALEAAAGAAGAAASHWRRTS